ncbi:hypothetical protein GCM10009416_08670 [Craurococcus roseus]|uniref:Uncharacterized protein n=1 Tax=Craurococcus roseus TaxID=77585 RepID=A0ABN1ERA7_9PROT
MAKAAQATRQPKNTAGRSAAPALTRGDPRGRHPAEGRRATPSGRAPVAKREESRA